MNTIFPGFEKATLQKLGAENTAKEIAGQPQLWLDTWKYLNEVKKELSDFLGTILKRKNLSIIFSGAGTSAFIGEVLQGVFLKERKLNVRAIATTDIVTHPRHYLHPTNPTLLVSFARSGKSPESMKTVELANACCENIVHLIITCNPNGKLAKESKGSNCFVFFLPPESNDQSLAMTGSFSSMLLTGIFISRFEELSYQRENVQVLAEYGTKVLNEYTQVIQSAAQLDFKRAVFLGSGIFQGIARESHLKLQELTNGKVICKFDSFLGFRHGPRAVIDSETLIVYLFSNNPYVQQYEKDLVQSNRNGHSGMMSIGIMEHAINGISLDEQIILADKTKSLDECFLRFRSTSSVCKCLCGRAERRHVRFIQEVIERSPQCITCHGAVYSTRSFKYTPVRDDSTFVSHD